MDRVAAPGVGSEAPTGINRFLNSAADRRATGARRYQPMVAVTLAVAAGIVWDRYGPQRLVANAADSISGCFWFYVWWFGAALFVAAWWIARRRRCDAHAGWLLLMAAALAGAAWHQVNWFLYDANEIGRYAGFEPGPVCIEAVVLKSPERVSAPPPTPLRAIPVGERSRLPIALTGIRSGSEWQPASGACQLSAEGHLLGVHQGDRLRVFGQLAKISPQSNPGEFDFADHARASRQTVRIRTKTPESVTMLAKGSIWNPFHVLDAIRVRAKQRVRSLIGPNHAGLAAAILLGAREGLPYETTESYLVTGTIHVLVVSGMNVAILATGLLLMMQLGWMPRRAGLCLIVGVVLLYALLAEAQPPVVRAAVFSVLMCVAVWSGRRGAAFNSIFAAAFVVMAMNPNDLFGAGPQLSFLAVGILIWIGMWIDERKKIVERLDQVIAETRPWPVRLAKWSWTRIWIYWLLFSTVLWLASLPLVLHQFHIVSPIAIVISPAIWLVVFVAMWSGFFMIVAGWIAPVIGAGCAAICNCSLDGLEHIVHWAESVPAGHAWLPGPAWWWVAGFYVGLLAVMIWGRRIAPPRWQLAALAAWVLVGLMPVAARHWTRAGLDCTVVAVGHGECVLLQAPSGETLLYDAGGIGSPEYATQSISAVLWDKGIMHIDGIVLSHSDTDHYNAVPGLLERFGVGAVYISPVMFRGIDDTIDRGPKLLRDAIRKAGVPIREIWSGDRLRVGPDVSVQVLHPPEKGVIGSDNANSVTLGVEYAGRRILLPGDLESPGIDDVMAEQPYDCDVLLAPHHGSRRSDPPGFAAWSTPEWVVLSGGGGEQAAPVIRTYEEAGAHVFVTDEVGAVQFLVKRNSRLAVTTFRPVPKENLAALPER
jgi:competence protein ComEC